MHRYEFVHIFVYIYTYKWTNSWSPSKAHSSDPETFSFFSRQVSWPDRGSDAFATGLGGSGTSGLGYERKELLQKQLLGGRLVRLQCHFLFGHGVGGKGPEKDGSISCKWWQFHKTGPPIETIVWCVSKGCIKMNWLEPNPEGKLNRTKEQAIQQCQPLKTKIEITSQRPALASCVMINLILKLVQWVSSWCLTMR